MYAGFWTGCKDINNKKMYEGDIVKVTFKGSGTTYFSAIEFRDGMFGVYVRSYTIGKNLLKISEDVCDAEVIGSIYDKEVE